MAGRGALNRPGRPGRPCVGGLPRSAPRPVWRRPAGALVLAVVVLAHAAVLHGAGRWWAAPRGPAEPARMVAVYTRTVELQAPPAAAPRAVPPAPAIRSRPAARAPEPAWPASAPAPAAPEAAASAPAAGVDPADAAPDPATGRVADAPRAASSDPVGEPVSEPVSDPVGQPPLADAHRIALPAATPAPVFEWPVSTRLSYSLQGYYRGEVSGSAQVEWLRDGDRYEVHVEVTVGPRAASLMGRRMSSRGRITAGGLAPERYDEDTRLAFNRRHAVVQFDGGRARLSTGREMEAPPGTQDAASQFVQLTFRLTTEPQLLQVGRTIDFPLALPKRLDRWYYEVVGVESLATPFGPVDGYHLVPRRETPTRDALLAEMWFAPQLQYLPVRIRIRQDTEAYLDLLIDRLPEQAAAPVTPASGTRP